VNIRKARNAISAFLRHQERFVISGLLLPDIVPSRMLDQVAVAEDATLRYFMKDIKRQATLKKKQRITL